MADATQTTPTTINYDDFAKLDLRIGTVTECIAHPNADKLLLLKVDIAGDNLRLRWTPCPLSAGTACREADHRGGQPRPTPNAARSARECCWPPPIRRRYG